MPIFENKQGKLSIITEVQFSLEKDIQNLTEQNLREVFSLQFVRSEFSLNNLRIDTLAYDTEINAFVVIEYKKDKNFSLIDQGYAYLALMLNNKADFILEYNGRCNQTLKKDDVDWSQSRVLFISPSFSDYQLKAIHFKDIPFELWEIKKFDNNSVLFNQLKSPETNESITKISKQSAVVREVSKEVKVYTEEEHLDYGNKQIQELYTDLKSRALSLGTDIEIKPRKLYIGFKRKSNFMDIEIQKSNIKVYINLQKDKLIDPQKIARDVSNKGHWGNGDYVVLIAHTEELPYLMGLVKQSYDKHI